MKKWLLMAILCLSVAGCGLFNSEDADLPESTTDGGDDGSTAGDDGATTTAGDDEEGDSTDKSDS